MAKQGRERGGSPLTGSGALRAEEKRRDRAPQHRDPVTEASGRRGGGHERRRYPVSAEDEFPRLTTAHDKSYRSDRTAPTLVGFALGQARTITTIK